MSHEHLEFTHADSGSWAPPPFLLLLQGGGGCCNHRFSLCCFSSCGAPTPKAGWLRGVYYTAMLEAQNSFLVWYLTPLCHKALMAWENGRCPSPRAAESLWCWIPRPEPRQTHTTWICSSLQRAHSVQLCLAGTTGNLLVPAHDSANCARDNPSLQLR